MKPADFIKEDHNIVQAVVEMHDDHEIQMAREQCYHAASNAIELHRMLKHITEREGLEGWVQEKITLANDYLSQVKDWMEHEMMNRMAGSHMNMPLEQMGEDATAGATSAGAMAGPWSNLAKIYTKAIGKHQDVSDVQLEVADVSEQGGCSQSVEVEV